MSYSFVKQTALIALQHIRDILHCQRTCYVLYYDATTEFLHMSRYEANSDELHTYRVSDDEFQHDIRAPKRLQVQWFSPENIPVKAQHAATRRMEIFDEEQNTVLCLRLKNEIDARHDLLFVEFGNHISLPGIQAFNAKNISQYKDLLGQLLLMSISAVLQNSRNDMAVFELMQRQTMKIVESARSYKAEANAEQEMHKRSIAILAREQINKLSLQLSRPLLLSDEAIELLWTKREAIASMQDAISDAVKFGCSMFPNNTEPLVVYSEYFRFDSQPETQVLKNNLRKNSADKLQRAEQFLYRISKAVELLLSKSENITGKTVGSACEPPVTAPAISEFIQKYTPEIVQIINENPGRWQLITKMFRPIQNVLYNQNLKISKTG